MFIERFVIFISIIQIIPRPESNRNKLNNETF